jgi:hypothetical protein
MTNEQARKLLGGYATNSLTEAERKALFEAALDDQELFDALQQEEALKELLADPVSRNQVQQALAQAPAPGATGAAWWSRSWVWGGLTGAAAAAVMIVAVIRSNEPSKEMARVQSAPQVSAQDSTSAIPTPAEPKLKQPEPDPRKLLRAARVDQPANGRTSTGAVSNAVTLQGPAAAPAAPPAPPPPPPQQVPTSEQQAQQERSQGTIQGQIAASQAQSFRQERSARDGERPQAAKAASAIGGFAAAPGVVADYKGPLLQYSLVKRDTTGADSPFPASARPQPGDAIKLTVLPGVQGYLSLYQLEPSGDWKRLFPATEQGLLVAANARQTIPDSPIIVTTTEQKLRLMLVPVAAQQAAPAPLVMNITIGPNK